ncbi:MAG: alpha/beta hydrolase [Naasia sp.]|uniref:esterase/lipase family protein n=1 Tax=Naasia sp. TaxID=2546198 RepID=UPI002611392C|nr:alpha/beta hydrolase [Naasia sp.]MCU1571315.1 alpha/beta hydrolase [Naasia sp.]
MRTLGHAWYWLLDYLYVAYWQVQGFLFRIDPSHYRGPELTGRPVLLIPGIYETWQFMRPVADLVRKRGSPVHVVPTLHWNTATVASSADLVAEYLEEHDLRNVLVVAHSKGGLIGKYAMLRRDPSGRIARMIAISTPFSGSVYARWFLLRSIRDFSPADPTLRMLGEQLEANSRITSIWGAFDPHIPGGSRLEGATNVVLHSSGHFRIFGQRDLLEAVGLALDDKPAVPDGATSVEPAPGDSAGRTSRRPPSRRGGPGARSAAEDQE